MPTCSPTLTIAASGATQVKANLASYTITFDNAEKAARTQYSVTAKLQGAPFGTTTWIDIPGPVFTLTPATVTASTSTVTQTATTPTAFNKSLLNADPTLTTGDAEKQDSIRVVITFTLLANPPTNFSTTVSGFWV